MSCLRVAMAEMSMFLEGVLLAQSLADDDKARGPTVHHSSRDSRPRPAMVCRAVLYLAPRGKLGRAGASSGPAFTSS